MTIHIPISHVWLWGALIWVVCAFVAAITMSASSGAGVEATAHYFPLMLFVWPAFAILSIVVAPFALMDSLGVRLAARRRRTNSDGEDVVYENQQNKMKGSL